MAISEKKKALHAVDTQIDILNLYGSTYGERFMQGFLADMKSKGRGIVDTVEWIDPVEWPYETGRIIAREISTSLKGAPTYFVTEDMMDLTIHAGGTVPPEPFRVEELPTRSGFVMLDRPLQLEDVNGMIMSARAFAWWVTQVVRPDGPKVAVGSTEPEPETVIMYTLFSDKTDVEYDEHTRRLKETSPKDWISMPRYALCHWQPIDPDRPWGWKDPTQGREVATTVMPKGYSFEWMAFLRTFFLLVRQEVATVSPQQLNRASLKRARGSGLFTESDSVQVITLRKHRPTSSDEIEGDGTVNWSHRWMVAGHWRDQYYPSTGEHRPIFIQSFIKGPENKPLKIKDKVFFWKR